MSATPNGLEVEELDLDDDTTATPTGALPRAHRPPMRNLPANLPPPTVDARLAILETTVANLVNEVTLLRRAEEGARRELVRLLVAVAIGGPAGAQFITTFLGG